MGLIDFALPDIGEGLHQAEIVEWLVAVGDTVREDQPIVEVQTDKAVVEIPAPASGVLSAHGAAVGDTVLVGATLFQITTPADVADVADAGPSRPALAAGTPSRAAARPKASPATRKRALELGIDLATVSGSGPGGRIVTADLEAPAAVPAPAGAARPPAPRVAVVRATGEDRIEPLRGTRRQIARAMHESWTTIPHVTELREIDATALVRTRQVLRQRLDGKGVKLTFLPLLVKAVVAALREHPNFNASLDLDAEQIVYRARTNIGIATSSDDGLVVPVIHDADQKSVADIARELDDLAAKVRNRTVTVDQLSGGTFTVSNYGSFGTWMGTPIIRPPEAAIAGFGRIADSVVAVDGRAVVRPTLPIAVSADHRLNDGHHLGAFVTTLAEYLVDPVLLFAEVEQWS